MPDRDDVTLVLGGGGVPGFAYLAGALRALRDVTGFDPREADLLIGTSAGAVAGALLRQGCPVDELVERGLGADHAAPTAGLLEASWGDALELGRRMVGSAWVLGRSVVRVPWPAPPRVLARAFPGGLAALRDDETVELLDDDWPHRALWLVTVDLVTGRRAVLGADADSRLSSLRGCVRASAAVPWVLPPVRVGRRLLVDGGAHSVTNLDLAARAGGSRVLCVAPMAYDPRRPPALARRALRAPFNRRLLAEYRRVRRAGKTTLVVRPGAAELVDYPLNFLGRHPVERLEQAAHRQTAEVLASPAGARWLRGRDDRRSHPSPSTRRHP